MSYNSELDIQCGIDNHTATVTHNSCEVWKNPGTRNTAAKCIEFLQFKEIIDPKTFIPSIKILKECQFTFTFDGLRDLQRQMQICQCGTFVVLCFMNIRREEIPNNFFVYLKNKLMSSFLFNNCDCSVDGCKPSNWCLLLQRVIDKGNRIPDQMPCFVNACVFNNIKAGKNGNPVTKGGKNQCTEFVPSLCRNVQKNLSIETVNWDFNYRNDGTWLYLGESFSTDIAEICINLKILPYISSRTKLKVK